MLEVLGGIFFIGLIVVLAFAGVAATTIAVVAVACVIIAAIFSLILGATVLIFKLLVAALLLFALRFVFGRVLTAIGEHANVPVLTEYPTANRIAWILAGVTTGYLYFLR